MVDGADHNLQCVDRVVMIMEGKLVSVKDSGNYQNFDKTRVKLFPNFMSIPFDYLLISWVTNYVHNRGRFRLVYTRRQKTGRVLSPTAQEEPSQGFSQGHFHHTSSLKPSPS